MDLGNVLNRTILPVLNRCAICSSTRDECVVPKADSDVPKHDYVRDMSRPEWHGWQAARRGLGTNLHRLGVPEKTIQAILRHANVSTTNTYYIKSAAEDARAAMAKLEQLVIGNEVAAEAEKDTGVVVTDNKLTIEPAGAQPALIQ